MRNTFHQAAITEKYIRTVVNDVMAIAVKLPGQYLFRDCHTDRIADALA